MLWVDGFLLHYLGAKNAQVGQRTVEVVGIGELQVVHHLQPLDYFAEDGVLSVQMGCAAVHRVGLLHLIGVVCAPIMALWGLPGEAATVLVTAIMSMGGGIGVAMSLFTSNIPDPAQLTILVPAIYLIGNPVQNVGRCLGISGVNTKHYVAIISICFINALLSIWAMRLILLFL